MPLVDAKCTNCGAPLKVDSKKEAAICEHCGSAFIVERAINNFNITNQNSIHAQVVNVFGSTESFAPKIAPVKQIQLYYKKISQTEQNRLLSPNELIEIIDFIESHDNLDVNALYGGIVDYCSNVKFSLDYSYNNNLECSIYSFQSLWKNAGNLGNDGENFTSWLLTKTSLLSGKKEILKTLQKALTEYYISLLFSGKTSAAWSSKGNGSIWGVERTTKKEFLLIDKKLNNSFLVPYFYKGIDNAKRLNSISVGMNYIFCLGKYAIINNMEYYHFEKNQDYIDSITENNREYYISEINELAKQMTNKTSWSLLKKYGVSLSSNPNVIYRIISLDNMGIHYRYTNPPFGVIKSEIKQIDDLRKTLRDFRLYTYHCPDCGIRYKGVFNKICPKCGKSFRQQF